MKLYKSLFTIACLTCFFNNLGFSMETLDDKAGGQSTSHKMMPKNATLYENGYGMSPDLPYFKIGFSLAIDRDGYLTLVNGKHEFHLNGWPLDSAGKPINSDGTTANETMLSTIRKINTREVHGFSRLTENVHLQVTLPSEELIFGANSAKKVRVPIIDSLGARGGLTFEFQRIGTASPLRWAVTITGNNPGDRITRKDGFGYDKAVDSTYPLTIEFGANGGRPVKYDETVNPTDNLQNAPALNIIWDANATAAAPQSINLDLGKVGSNTGIICVASPFFPTGQQIDGVAYGERNGIYIDNEGVVMAKFDNGATLPIYKLPSVLSQN